MTTENITLLEGVALQRDVVYNQDKTRPLTLHLLRPQTPPAGLLPVIVSIFGGAFKGGNKDGGVQRLIPFAQRGDVCASIEYRLSGEGLFSPERRIPPFLIVHGDEDPRVPFNQSELLVVALAAVGAGVEREGVVFSHETVAGSGAGARASRPPDSRARRPRSDPEDVDSFVDRTSKDSHLADVAGGHVQ